MGRVIDQARRAIKELGRNVKVSRERQGMTQQELADLSRITQADISKLEHGRIVLDEVEMEALAKTLGWRDGDSVRSEA